MKKLLFILLCSIAGSTFAQSTVPNSVIALGTKFSSTYTEFANNVKAVKNSMAPNSLNNTRELYIKANDEWNIQTKANSVNFVSAMPDNFSQMISRNDYSIRNIATNNLSQDVNDILSKLMAGIDTLSENTGFDQYLLNYSQLVVSSNTLSSYDKDVISFYIMSLNVAVENITANVNSQGRFSLWGAIKCAAGTVGGAVLGGIAGAGVGTVTLPIIGTVSGAAVGFYAGGLVGMAASC